METKKFNYKSAILLFLAVVALLVLFGLNQEEFFRKAFELKSLDVGRPAPNFEFPGLDGKLVSLNDYRGKENYKMMISKYWLSALIRSGRKL
jgi:hypothetical protein